MSVLILPIMGHMYGNNSGFKEVVFFGFPFGALALYLAWEIHCSSLKKESMKTQFIGHLTGSALYLFPYYLIGHDALNSLDAPQGPGIFLYPVSAPFVILILYRAWYSFVVKVMEDK